MLYRIIVITSTIFILLAVSFQTSAEANTSNLAVTYYVDIKNSSANDKSDYGSINRPWKTLTYALKRLKAGDTLLVRGGTYPGSSLSLGASYSGTAQAPITVKAYPGETAIWRNPQQTRLTFAGAGWWVIEGLIFEGQVVQIGTDMQNISRNIRLSGCSFRNGTSSALQIFYAEHIVVENCHFQRIQSQEAGRDVNAINIPYYADDVVIRQSRFEDISSDGVHLGDGNKSVTNVTLESNEFWINNPDQVFLGENAIDVKWVKGPVYIRSNIIHGFRPTVAGQNASGANGNGIVIHNNSQNVIIERNLFYDNTSHLGVSLGVKGTPGGVRNITIYNNIFKGARANSRSGELKGGYGLNIDDVTHVQVYHNTFYDNDIFLKTQGVTDFSFINNIVYKGKARFDSITEWQMDHNIWSQVDTSSLLALQISSDLSTTSNLNLDKNLRPLSNSPVINKGRDLNIPNDFDGIPRSDGAPDIGAFEYRGSTQPPLPTPTSVPTEPISTFAENFETGNLATWSTVEGNSTDIKLSESAARFGTKGLSITVSDELPRWLELDKLANLRSSYARFYINPKNLKMAAGDLFLLAQLNGNEKAAQVQLSYNNTGYRLRLGLFQNNSEMLYTNWVFISNAWHSVEFNFVTASTAGAKDAQGNLWVDGKKVATLTAINNNQTVTHFGLGLLRGLDSGTKGNLFFDEVKVASNYIGLEEDGTSPTLALAGEASVPATELLTMQPVNENSVTANHDVNGDGMINILDLALIASHYGTADIQSDLTGDGTVNLLDLVTVANSYSQTGTITPTLTAMPSLTLPLPTETLAPVLPTTEPSLPTEMPTLPLPTLLPSATNTPTPTETSTLEPPTPTETSTSIPSLPTETPIPMPEMPTETPTPAPLPGEPSTPYETPTP